MRAHLTVVASVLLASLAAACDKPRDPQGGGDALLERDAVYAVQSLIFGDQGRFSYISLLPTLDAQATVVLANAREFPEYSPADAFDGRIVVGDGEAPELTAFRVTDAGEWIEGETISFSGKTSLPIDTSIYVGAEKAYVPFDGTSFAVWNPKTFTLTGEIAGPAEIPLVRGEFSELSVHRGFANAQRDGLLYQPYYFADSAFQVYDQTSQVAVVETATDTIVAVHDVACPHLHIATEDDAGNLYFSNGQGSIASAVLNPEAPRNCLVKFPAGGNAPGETVLFKDLADGREGSNFFHIAGDLGFFNVYHAERDNVTTETPPETISYSSNYHLWTLDLSTMTAQPMEGIDFSGGQFVAYRIDGRVFITVPAADYKQTSVFEVSAEGRAKKLFDVEGWAFKMFRVR